MRPRLPGLTALLAAAAFPAAAAIPASAAANTLSGGGFTSGPAFAGANPAFASVGTGGVKVHHGSTHIERVLEVRSGDRQHRRDRHRGRDGFGGFYSGPRDGYDINRNWASDSYNDWWHDRPDRAFPRWMQSNQDCERQWWSGGGWRC